MKAVERIDARSRESRAADGARHGAARLANVGLLAPALLAAASPARSAAQTSAAAAPPAPGALWIRVVDPALSPVAGAELVLPMLGLSLRVPEGGALLLTGVPAGVYLVQARQVGFSPAWQTLRVGRDTVVAQLALGRIGQTLDTMTVRGIGGALDPHLADFERRRTQRGSGHFLTREDVEQRHPADLASLLRVVPGVTVATGGGATTVLSRRTVGVSRCSGMLVFLDGVRLSGGLAVDAGVRFPSEGPVSTGSSGMSGGYRPGTVGTATTGTPPVRGGPGTSGTSNTPGSTPTGTGSGTGTGSTGNGSTGTTTSSGTASGARSSKILGSEPDWGAMAATTGVGAAFDLNTIPMSLLAGAEIYTSIAGVPAEYAAYGGAECGVVLLWSGGR